MKGRPSRHDIKPKSWKLTGLEEEAIFEHIIDLDTQGFPPKLANMEDIANLPLAEHAREKVSKL
jgi:hypothetical protein